MNSKYLAIAATVTALLVIFLVLSGFDEIQIPTPWGDLKLKDSDTAITPTLMTEVEPRTVLPRWEDEVHVTSSQPITLRVRWAATTPELAEDNANKVQYSVFIDGDPVPNLDAYRQPAKLVKNSFHDSDGWWVYWDYPVGNLSIGEHVLAVKQTVKEDIYDGRMTTLQGDKGIYGTTVFVNP